MKRNHMTSTELVDAAQADVTEAARQLAAWARTAQAVQSALEQCAHTLAAIGRPVLQGEPGVAEGLEGARRALQGAAQTVPDQLAQMHADLKERLSQAHSQMDTLVEAWDVAAHAQPDLPREEEHLHARLQALHDTYATERAEAAARHQAQLRAQAKTLAQVEGQVAEARRLRDRLTAL